MTSATHVVPTKPAARGMFREVLAVLLLTVGSVIPILGWLVGVALLWTSDRWKVGEKLLGTLVWPFGYTAVLAVATMPVQMCSSVDGGPETCTGPSLGPGHGLLVFGILLVAPLVVGAHLLLSAHRRARVDRADPLAHG